MDPTFSWMSRFTNYCVTVVEHTDPGRVLAAFGAEPETAVSGGAREELDLYTAATGYRPVVRVVERGRWCVAIEGFSFEGKREPVLRRLSATGRVLWISLDHLPEYTMGFADRGAGIGRFRVPERGDSGWRELEAVADRFGVSLENWSDHDRIRHAVQFIGEICGFPIDDSVMGSPGASGVILPLLPEAFAESGPVFSEIGAQIVALAESGAGDELAPAVAEQVRRMSLDAGIDSDELLAALAQPVGGVEDDSPAGRALRRVIAEQWRLVGSPMGSRDETVNPQQVNERVSAGVTAAALLKSGPKAAVAEMLHRRPGADWRTQLVADWEGVALSPEATETAAARLAAHKERQARRIPLPTGWIRDRSEARARAVPRGELRPTSAEAYQPESW